MLQFCGKLHFLSLPYFLPGWRVVWETGASVSFFSYAVFIMLPIQRLPSRAFWAFISCGSVLAVGSIWMSKEPYCELKVGFLDGSLLSHAMAWILLIPIYAYIPIVILSRKHVETRQATEVATLAAGRDRLSRHGERATDD